MQPTLTPWGQFYIQSSVRDKGVKSHEYGLLKADVLFGAFFTNFIAFFIVVVCGATLFYSPDVRAHGLNDALQACQALKPLAGGFATTLFAVGLFNASCFGAITVPLSTAYSITEALGWESGMGRRMREAPLFVGLFTALIVIGALTLGAGVVAPSTDSVALAAELPAAQATTVQKKATCRVMGPEEWYLVTGQVTEYGGMLCVR